jgi:hypothetical protein
MIRGSLRVSRYIG